MGACGRCWDRGCTCDEKKTKQLVQEDYEDKNTGAEFMFEFRYSNILTVLAVAFLYSGGLPILYPVAAIFFFITYWMDKCLLFHCYRKPVQFDNYLAKGTLGYFKYILVGHIAGFLLMYGLTPILQHDLFEQFVPKEIGLIEQEEFSLFPYYFWFIAAIMMAYVIWTLFIKSFIKIGRRYCSTATRRLSATHFEQDFFSCINYMSLK